MLISMVIMGCPRGKVNMAAVSVNKSIFFYFRDKTIHDLFENHIYLLTVSTDLFLMCRN